MENIYDNEEFFQRYAEMSRSKYGLDGSADWPTLKSLLPDLKNINMLDIGCGYGWHCLYAQENGAKKVIGVDLSKKMINKALEMDPLKLIDYRIGSFDDFSFDHASFD